MLTHGELLQHLMAVYACLALRCKVWKSHQQVSGCDASCNPLITSVLQVYGVSMTLAPASKVSFKHVLRSPLLVRRCWKASAPTTRLDLQIGVTTGGPRR